jgi:N-acyl-D-amino-acid deacylase
MHDLPEAVEETVRTAQAAGVKLHISHLKAMGEKNWDLLDETLGMIEAAGNSGLDVNFDVYPYTTTGSVLYIFLPDWVAEGGKRMMIQRLKDPGIRAKAIEEMKNNSIDYSKIVISISSLDKTLNRKKISEIAATQGKTVEEAVVDILVASNGRVITSLKILSEKNVIKLIRHPLSLISSNGSGYNIEHKESGELVHPRNFGTFPRVLAKYVKREGILSWEEAIHKMSGKPADKFNIAKRGTIREGNFADVIVLDPEEIQDLATEENPYQYSRGINWVMVNGKVVLENGKYNGKREGEVIRR